ncbi:hypothetical protein RMATCC62417_17263 [Rhizopus microsporus]|nr:hypothetical protein RMATCC62417_17263 [Rhizopus microsporus]
MNQLCLLQKYGGMSDTVILFRFERDLLRKHLAMTVRKRKYRYDYKLIHSFIIAIVFVYDYHPCAKTLLQHYFRSAKQMFKPAVSTQSKGAPLLVSEKTLWSYIVQITSAIKAIHSSGLACRNIQLNRILITGEDRIRLTGVGILDVLQGEADQQLIEYQQQDFISLGTMIIQLACNLSTPSQNITQSLEYLSRMYSEDLKILVSVLMDENTPKSIDDILTLIAPRILEKINRNHFHNDDLEQCLGQELENGRLVRLISKMGFINERPEFDMDPSWSETGDRYLIKLFRDYVFHQVDEHGQPVIDMVHVLTCLKKLDAGIDEKIMLMSRDEKSCLIVSYKEIKNCIMSAYADLSSGRK